MKINIAGGIALVLTSQNAMAFACKTIYGDEIVGGGKGSVVTELSPEVQMNQNLVIDMSQYISCVFTSDNVSSRADYAKLTSANFDSALNGISGSVNYDGVSIPVPFSGLSSNSIEFPENGYVYKPWNVQLYLAPLNNASGLLVAAGQKYASISMLQTNNYDGTSSAITWDLIAKK
ncbi:fimbrial protein [Serratia ureilytica]|uniref:fimbrial protein n=1 Tax=Serratia ureilytica TaxID=300181 RepID=UPI0034C6B7F0